MAQQKRILLLTNSEYGQANVILAVAQELQAESDFEIHVASFSTLKSRVNHLCKPDPKSEDVGPIIFHAIDGPSGLEAFRKRFGVSYMVHPPGFFGAIRSYNRLPEVFVAWDGPEYIQGFESCMEVVDSINPTVIVIDPLFRQGIDACKRLERKYTILTPGSVKDLIAPIQPHLAGYWKFPVVSSGFPFPLPWYYVFANIYLIFRSVFCLILSSRVRMLASTRKEHGITATTRGYVEKTLYITPALPEIDFPLIMPKNITACGPILLPEIPVAESDPELTVWLQKGPTILVNLGSLAASNASSTRELATGLKVVLDRRQNLQVLWKLTSERYSDDSLAQILLKEIAEGRVRIVNWLVADPLAILQSGHVACSVHHGGANSYYEATASGVPQVVLPVWLDTYDFATRAEWLGIGIYGNRSVAPQVDATELGHALTEILCDDVDGRARSFRERAKALAKICEEAGGRKTACDKIIELAGREEGGGGRML